MSGEPISVSTLLRAGYEIRLCLSGNGTRFRAKLHNSNGGFLLAEYGEEYDHALGSLERRLEEATDLPAVRVREFMRGYNARKP